MNSTTKLIALLLFVSTSLAAHPGVGIVEDSKGNVFFTDLKQVWKIDLYGKKSVVVPNVHTHELFMDEQDNLFGEHLWYNGEEKDTWGYYVWKLSPRGTVEKVIPDTEGFRENYSFVRERTGAMYWANRNEACQTITKRKGSKNTEHGHGCFHNIRFMHAADNGELLVVDFQDIKKIDKQGNVKTIATQIADRSMAKSTIENQNSVMGIWDDPHGNIYTAVYKTREVKKFTPNGKQEVVFKASIPWAPSGGMISRSGELWVMESSFTNSVRVVKVLPGGGKRIF